MSKYSYEFKLKVVKEYYEGGGGARYLAKKYGVVSVSQIQVWINIYEQTGEQGLKPRNTHSSYTSEFKLHVIQYRQINRLSYKETANIFKISRGCTIANWQRIYSEKGFEGLSRPIGRSKKVPEQVKDEPAKKLKESEKEELIRLREENQYLKASIAYQKKLNALVQERVLKTKKKPK